jgi:hypothetical protein
MFVQLAWFGAGVAFVIGGCATRFATRCTATPSPLLLHVRFRTVAVQLGDAPVLEEAISVLGVVILGVFVGTDGAPDLVVLVA